MISETSSVVETDVISQDFFCTGAEWKRAKEIENLLDERMEVTEKERIGLEQEKRQKLEMVQMELKSLGRARTLFEHDCGSNASTW